MCVCNWVLYLLVCFLIALLPCKLFVAVVAFTLLLKFNAWFVAAVVDAVATAASVEVVVAAVPTADAATVDVVVAFAALKLANNLFLILLSVATLLLFRATCKTKETPTREKKEV